LMADQHVTRNDLLSLAHFAKLLFPQAPNQAMTSALLSNLP